MKRALDEESLKPSKRFQTDMQDNEDSSNPNGLFILKHQNKYLNLELQRVKRELKEQKRDFDLIQNKSREMESIVSIIQRAWDQLDADSSLLLNCLGSGSDEIPNGKGSFILDKFLDINKKYFMHDPMNIEDIPTIDVDRWSSKDEIENEKKNSIEKVITEIEEDENESSNIGGKEFKIGEALIERIKASLIILGKLNSAMNQTHCQLSSESLSRLLETKDLIANNLFLSNKISKLKIEIIELRSTLQISENEKDKLEKKLYLMSTTNRQPETEKCSSDDFIVKSPTPVNKMDASSLESKIDALKDEIFALKSQLDESETAKSNAERQLTEKISQSVAQHKTNQLADIRKSMEDLKSQCKQEVTHLLTEIEVLQNKVSNYEIALKKVEEASSSKISNVISQAEAQISIIKSNNLKLQAKLNSLQADQSMVTQYKEQLKQFQTIETSFSNETNRLQKEVGMLKKTLSITQQNLEKSRQREMELERGLTDVAANDNDRNYEQLNQQSNDKIRDLQQELSDAQLAIDDMILEIESISSDIESVRNQNSALLSQISESQGIQREALEENLKLHNKVDELKESLKENESKAELIKSIMVQQDKLLHQIRSNEQDLKKEIVTLKKSQLDLLNEKNGLAQQLLDIKQTVNEMEIAMQDAAHSKLELQNRCNDLTEQCENERKQKMEAQRVATGQNKSQSQDSGQAISSSLKCKEMSPDDMDMLDMTLNMLRCSVCKDRFKNVAITRCYHLFCKECVDENLRNRSRKCPACGERFGQDDVVNIYFTD